MKNILILSSSPRKDGNTDLLCKAFAEGASEAGHSVETIRIADKNIGFCKACYACQKLKRCAINDDTAEVLQKMMAADVIVLSSPVYFYSVSAQLKALFDRTVAIYPNLTGKEYYFLMAMADTERDMFSGTIHAMQGFLDCYEGSVLKGTLCADGLYEKGAILDTHWLADARELGRNA